MAQAHHIAIAIGEADKADATIGLSTVMRVSEEVMIVAVAGAQSGKALPSIPVTLGISKNDDEAITLEDGVITAAGVGSAEVMAESELAGIAGKLTVTVTKPIDAIVFMVGDSDGPSELNLAAGETYGSEITAVAHDEDGEAVEPRSNWSWDSTDKSVATVTVSKDPENDKKVKVIGQYAMITGKGSGSAEIMATAEGESGSISVTVTGQRITREIDPSSSNNGNNFVWDRGKTGGAGFTTPDIASGDATTEFEVNLRDLVSSDLLEVWNLGVTPAAPVAGTAADPNASPATAQVDPAVGAAGANNGAATVATGGSVTVTVTASQVPEGITEGTYETFVSLTATGAREARLRFTITVINAPE
ncbi:MAG: hypothetical protein OXG98_08205 [Gemmatimonadetes bacterium]|nr:hypothetical protein [Gemmatimonadota bacterium]